MSLGLNQIKPVVLTFAMLIAVALNCSRASATETQTAIAAGGCLWCADGDFAGVAGVVNAVTGIGVDPATGPAHDQIANGGAGIRHQKACLWDQSA